MLFNTLDYWLFFFAVLAIFYSLPFRLGKVFLLVASYLFYMHWDARFVLLILASTIIDYALGRLLESPDIRRRRVLLMVSLVANLGILGFFKYYNFFADSLANLMGLSENSFALNIILPVGISFYTFASLSYTIDVYWGKTKAVRNFVDYAFFVAFFPHLVAGPIVRARQFIPQITNWAPPSAFVLQEGIMLILSGLIKKMVFADRFAIAAEKYYGGLTQHPGWLAAWSGTFAFAMQIYFDFSGYTDIARGCAKLLGFEFPLNFTRPYLAANIAEFWQRWHISLTIWIRDYVFMPLTRQRRNKFIIYRNILITMGLVGLWHGASWNFVLWGIYCGGLVIAHRVFHHAIRGTKIDEFLSAPAFHPLFILITFCSIVMSMPLFRTSTLQEAATVIWSMFAFAQAPGENMLTTALMVLALISIIIAVMEERSRAIERIAFGPVWIQIPAYVLVFLAIELFSVTTGSPTFIYFQF